MQMTLALSTCQFDSAKHSQQSFCADEETKVISRFSADTLAQLDIQNPELAQNKNQAVDLRSRHCRK